MFSPRDSLEELDRVRRLSDQGRYTEVLEYLGARGPVAVAHSPTLALLYGIAHARLGRHDESTHWVDVALDCSLSRGDRTVEARALNVRGAMALERGRIDEADDFLRRALAEAEDQDDHATVGRCCNNLGIIANLRGAWEQAVTWYTMAMAAFQRAGLQQGLAEAENNLRISYRDLGDLDRALEFADRAVYRAQAAGNLSLMALAIAGRAEVRVLAGEPEVARREIERSVEMNRNLGDVVGEAEALRVFAMMQVAAGETDGAESTYRDVIARAELHQRPMIAADAGRALAELLLFLGRPAEALDAARGARVRFASLGAEAEIARLDALIHEMA